MKMQPTYQELCQRIETLRMLLAAATFFAIIFALMFLGVAWS